MTRRASDRVVVHIVDDDAAVRKGFSRLMKSAELDPRTYESAEDFLNQIRQGSCACLLLDITMPQITGLEVQARLTAKGIDLPVIAVSAREDEETRQRARELGAKLFLRKPVDDQALIDAIAWVVGLARD